MAVPLAHCNALCAYASLVICSTCHGPQVSLPRPQYLTCICVRSLAVLWEGIAYIVWPLMAVFPAKVGIVCVSSAIAVFHPGQSWHKRQ